ncbi:MAG: glycosyltransferase [Gammaproteobacteria bacterium]|nr:MAG: glycosyltransferase [Gammaproteobacteria bacterium]UCH39480.1 MAG: glycosyltransferase [Gammaproteobacteria bacterium]
MRISVVIPSYNRRHTLERALESVFAQTSPVDEVILVDDGSTDGSAEMVAKAYAAVKIIRQPNLGVSEARNRGINAARFDWIALLDSDDSWLPEKIARIRAAHAQHPDFVLFHSDEIWMRRGVRVNPMNKHRKSGGWIFEHCLPLCAISPSASVIRKSVLLESGLFDPALPACEDYDLWLRLCHRYPVHYLEAALIVKYGGHDDQLSRRHPIMDRFRVRALHRLLTQQTLSAEQRSATTAVLLAKLDILLKGAIKHDNKALIAEFAPLRDFWQRARQSC